MRPRSLLVLALVVAALLAFIWFFERDLPSTDERAEAARRVLAIDPDEVRAVVIERPGSGTLRLERTAAGADEAEESEGAAERGWRLVEPLAARADSFEARTLLDKLAGLEMKRTLDEADPDATGLAEPRVRVTLVTADGEESLRVGAEVPASGDLIVDRGGGGPAYVVAADFLEDLEREALDWRSRDLFAGSRDEIRRIRLIRGESAVVLARRGEDFWLEAPLDDRADKESVSTLLGDLVGIQAEGFVDDPRRSAAEMGLEPPVAAVEMELDGGGEPFRLELGSAADEEGLRFARLEGQTVTVPDRLDEELEREPAAWQAMTWTAFDSWEVDRVRVVDGEGELELERREGDWRRDGETVPYGEVSDLLYALTGAAAERLLTPEEAAPLAAGEPRLRLELEAGERREELELHPASAGGHLATVSGRRYRLLLPPATVEDLEVKLSAVRAAEPETADDEESE